MPGARKGLSRENSTKGRNQDGELDADTGLVGRAKEVQVYVHEICEFQPSCLGLYFRARRQVLCIFEQSAQSYNPLK